MQNKDKIMINFDEIELYDNYGTLLKRVPYRIVNEGYDWFLVRHHGKLVYVPKGIIVTEKDVKKEVKKQKRILVNYEDLI